MVSLTTVWMAFFFAQVVMGEAQLQAVKEYIAKHNLEDELSNAVVNTSLLPPASSSRQHRRGTLF